MSRKKSREFAFKLVFENFFHEPDVDIFLSPEDIVLDDTDKEFVNTLIGGINEHYEEIMDIIKNNIVGYELDRIYKVDLAILVLAVFELKYLPVELAKKYSTDKSSSFINGVLAKVIK